MKDNMQTRIQHDGPPHVAMSEIDRDSNESRIQHENALPAVDAAGQGQGALVSSQSTNTMPPAEAGGKTESGLEGLAVPPPPAEVSPVADDQDLASLALPQEFHKMAEVDGVVVSVKLAKPMGQTWFSAYAGHLEARYFHVLHDKAQNEFYVVHPSLVTALGADVSIRLLVPFITKSGSYGVWPIAMPDRDGLETEWSKSARSIVMKYGDKWIRLKADRVAGSYQAVVPLSDSWDPPVWDKDPHEVLKKAVTGSLITSLTHEVVKRLLGTE